MISARLSCILHLAALSALLAAVPATAAKKSANKSSVGEPCPPVPTISIKDTLIDSLSLRLKAADALVGQLESAKAGATREAAQLRDDSTRLASALAFDSTRIAELRDSLSRFKAFDSNVVLIDSVLVSDTLLNRWIAPMTKLAATGILSTGKGVRLLPRIPGHRECASVKVRMTQRNDTTWFSIDREGKIFSDSVGSTASGRIERLQHDVARKAFGAEAFPAETTSGLGWPVRLAVLGGATLLTVLTMVSLW